MLLFLKQILFFFLPGTDDYGYVFICANLGDCKAFLWSAKANSFVEVTVRNLRRRSRGENDAGERQKHKRSEEREKGREGKR